MAKITAYKEQNINNVRSIGRFGRSCTGADNNKLDMSNISTNKLLLRIIGNLLLIQRK